MGTKKHPPRSVVCHSRMSSATSQILRLHGCNRFPSFLCSLFVLDFIVIVEKRCCQLKPKLTEYKSLILNGLKWHYVLFHV